MRAFLGLVIAFALLGCAGGGSHNSQPIALTFAEDAGTPSAEVRTLAEDSAPGYLYVLISAPGSAAAHRPATVINGASATVVDPRGYAVTAAHIAKGTSFAAEVVTLDGRRQTAEIVDVAPERELALLRFDPELAEVPPKALPIAPSGALQRGDFVLALGTPDNKPGVATTGKVVSLRKDKRIQYGEFGFDDALVVEMEIVPGFSGGPLIDAQGRLAGIVASFALGDTTRVPYVSPRLAYAVPGDQVRAYLEEVLPGYGDIVEVRAER